MFTPVPPVVPAVKFDWLSHKGRDAIVHSLRFESPWFVLEKSGLLDEDVLAEGAARVGHAAFACSPPMKAGKIACRPCDTSGCSGAWRGVECGCCGRERDHVFLRLKVTLISSFFFFFLVFKCTCDFTSHDRLFSH